MVFGGAIACRLYGESFFSQLGRPSGRALLAITYLCFFSQYVLTFLSKYVRFN